MALSKAKIKYIRSLQQKKFRQKYNNFVVEGEKIADELLRERPELAEAVFALPEWIERNALLLEGLSLETTPVDPAELRKISSLNSPNQVLVLAGTEEAETDPGKLSLDLSLYLEGIRDPGNLGTILRIADWFAIPFVFLSPDCVDLYNPKVIQASMGAFLRVACRTESLTDLLDQQHAEIPVIGALLDGEDLFTASLPARGIVVIGNEAHGISAETEKLLTRRISIPKTEGGGAESLNAAVACGIICAVMRNRE